MTEHLQGRLARLDRVLEDAFESHGWQAFRTAGDEALRDDDSAHERSQGGIQATAPVPGWVAELFGRLDVLSRRVAATEETVAGAYELARSDDECPAWASALLDRVEVIAGRLDSLEALGSLEAVAGSRDGVEGNARPAWVDALAGRVEVLARRMTAAEETAATVADAVVSLREDVRLLAAEVDGRLAQVASTSEELRNALIGP